MQRLEIGKDGGGEVEEQDRPQDSSQVDSLKVVVRKPTLPT